MKLILGAGMTEREAGAWHVDIANLPGIDLVYDLNIMPWPFHDNEYDDIQAHDIIEHIEHVVKFLEECHRIGKAGCVVDIRTSAWDTEQSYTDPTHRHWFTLQSFDFFVPNTFFSNKYPWYSTKRFEKLLAQRSGAELVFRLRIVK
uniref:Putative methyltransferase n=1 Tax=viral metagenome TaxID=1070528 RepID=A0A6M3L3X1_9ZZZZ